MTLDTQAIRELMHNTSNVRHVCVLRSNTTTEDSSLIDHLNAKAHLYADRTADGREMDAASYYSYYCYEAKAGSHVLYYELASDDARLEPPPRSNGNAFLINLSLPDMLEVPSALRVSDGVLVVVDCFEGLGTQSEIALRQALGESVRPVLLLDNLDQALSMLQQQQLDTEGVYQV